MNTGKRDLSFGITEDRFDDGIHLCYIFNDDRERLKTMARFHAHGLAEGEKILCLIDAVTPEEMRACMEDQGVDLSAASKTFIMADAESAYCRKGAFSPKSLLDDAVAFYEQARREGYAGARISGDMSWVLRHNTPLSELLDYEARVFHCLKVAPVVAICEYDARKFDGATIMDVLSVHPAVMVRGQIVKNPYFVPPADFLETVKTGLPRDGGV